MGEHSGIDRASRSNGIFFMKSVEAYRNFEESVSEGTDALCITSHDPRKLTTKDRASWRVKYIWLNREMTDAEHDTVADVLAMVETFILGCEGGVVMIDGLQKVLRGTNPDMISRLEKVYTLAIEKGASVIITVDQSPVKSQRPV